MALLRKCSPYDALHQFKEQALFKNTGSEGVAFLKMIGSKSRSGNNHRRLRVNAGSVGIHTVNGKKVNGNCIDHGTPLKKENNVEGYLLGRFVEGRIVYRQSFVIRSYEIGPDKTATMETIMNLLQETALNHVASSGVSGNGFGATREMSIRKLIWVVTRVHIQVDSYSSWGDVIEIDTWVDAAGKNGMRRDWIIRDFNTQKIIARATSTWVIMNRETRRLCKIPDEVRDEVQPFYLNRVAISTEDADCEKIQKLNDETAHRIRSGLAPRWNDMDANQHVNNVKYIGWILESVPIKILEEYNLASMTLEYRRECRQSNVLESLTSIKGSTVNNGSEGWECSHLLRMEEDEVEIVRARSVWRCKQDRASI